MPSFAELDCLFSTKSIVNQAFTAIGRDTIDVTLSSVYSYEYVWDINEASYIYVFYSDEQAICHGSSVDTEFSVIPIHQF